MHNRDIAMISKINAKNKKEIKGIIMSYLTTICNSLGSACTAVANSAANTAKAVGSGIKNAAVWCVNSRSKRVLVGAAALTTIAAGAVYARNPEATKEAAKALASSIKDWAKNTAFPYMETTFREKVLPAASRKWTALCNALYTNGNVTVVGGGAIGAACALVASAVCNSFYRFWRSDARVAERDAARAERDAARAELLEVQNQRRLVAGDSGVLLQARQAAVAERNAARLERDAATAALAPVAAGRDAAIAERDAAIAERDAARLERDRALENLHVQNQASVVNAAERDAARLERDRALENLRLQIQPAGVDAAELEAARAERDAVVVERDAVVVERDAAMATRDAVLIAQAQVVGQRDAAIAQRDAAVTAHRELIERITGRPTPQGNNPDVSAMD